MATAAARSPAPARRSGGGGRRTRRRARSTTLDRVVFGFVRLAMGALGALPLAVAVRVAAGIARLAYWCAPGLRRTGMTNLAIAFPDKPLAERRRILRESIANLGRMAAELAHLPRLTDADLREMVVFEDEAWWATNVAAPRETGGLILSGHFGNWELLVAAHGMRGFPVSMVHRAIANPFI